MNTIISSVRSRIAPWCRILLPESQDIRVIVAAIRLKIDGIVFPVLFGDLAESLRILEDEDSRNKYWLPPLTDKERDILTSIEHMTVTDIGSTILIESYQNKKGGSIDDIKKLFSRDLSEAARLLKEGEVDGVLAWSLAETKDVIRVGYYALGLTWERRISWEFLMVPWEWSLIQENFIIGDSAVNPNPISEELVQIGRSLLETHSSFFPNEIPRIAFLSFSTHVSGVGASVDKIKEAVKLFREKYPDIEADWPLQLDAALSYLIYNQKTSGRWVLKGKPNILIFPDLNSGNIGYKMMERFGWYSAIWPILTGFAHPAWSDLSRGTSIDTIFDMAYVTALRALKK